MVCFPDEDGCFKSLKEFDQDLDMGTKPCLLFSGTAFDQDETMKRVQNLLIDFFRGPVVENVRLSGFEHAIQVQTSFKKKVRSGYRW